MELVRQPYIPRMHESTTGVTVNRGNEQEN